MTENFKKYMLPIITVTSGLLISGFFYLLQSRIQKTRKEREREIQKSFFPRGEYFLPVEKDLTVVQNQEKTDIGYLFTTSDPNGYGGTVRFIVAMNTDWTIRDFLMTEHAETPGLGTNVNDPRFRKGFQGVRPLKERLPGNKKEFSEKLGIDAISGATLSSMAVVRALAKKGEEYQDWWKKRVKERVDRAEETIMEAYEIYEETYFPYKHRRRKRMEERRKYWLEYYLQKEREAQQNKGETR